MTLPILKAAPRGVQIEEKERHLATLARALDSLLSEVASHAQESDRAVARLRTSTGFAVGSQRAAG